MSATTTTDSQRELAYRENHGLRVTLLWSPIDDNLVVQVYDTCAGQLFEIDAPRDAAMHVFHHPFAYLGRRSPRRDRTPEATPSAG